MCTVCVALCVLLCCTMCTHTQIIYDTWQNFLSAFKLSSLSYEVVHPRLGRNTKDTLGAKKKEERARDRENSENHMQKQAKL